MTFRALLPSFALFLALLPACAETGDDSGLFGTGGASSSDSSSAGKPGKNSGGAGRSGAPAPNSSSSAGASASANVAGPATWNSAKSATVGDAQLQAEYAAWKAAHVESCSDGSAVVLYDDTSVVSEGISYGLLLSVAMSDRPLFDGFWKFYQDHLDKNGLMNWKTAKCEAPGNNNMNAATDADLDATMALIQAASRWPDSATGYLEKAETLAGKILKFESEMCGGRRILRPGDVWGGCSDVINPRIKPSYFSPAYYKVFARYFSSQAATWLALGDASYQLFAIYQARMNNLVPDESRPDGSDYNGSQYWYDACRTPWRVAVDYAWTGDPRAKTFMQNLSSWVGAHGGLPKASQQQNSAFVGAFALAGAYDQATFDSYMSGWLGAELDDAPHFQGSLRVLYLLVAAGKFSSTL